MSGSGVSTAARADVAFSVTRRPLSCRPLQGPSVAAVYGPRRAPQGRADLLCAWSDQQPSARRRDQSGAPMSITRTSTPDLQAARPRTPISLSKAGVTRSAKAIRIRHNGDERLFQAEIQCSVDLNPVQKGVHMSRFEE